MESLIQFLLYDESKKLKLIQHLFKLGLSICYCSYFFPESISYDGLRQIPIDEAVEYFMFFSVRLLVIWFILFKTVPFILEKIVLYNAKRTYDKIKEGSRPFIIHLLIRYKIISIVTEPGSPNSERHRQGKNAKILYEYEDGKFNSKVKVIERFEQPELIPILIAFITLICLIDFNWFYLTAMIILIYFIFVGLYFLELLIISIERNRLLPFFIEQYCFQDFIINHCNSLGVSGEESTYGDYYLLYENIYLETLEYPLVISGSYSYQQNATSQFKTALIAFLLEKFPNSKIIFFTPELAKQVELSRLNKRLIISNTIDENEMDDLIIETLNGLKTTS